MEAYPMPYMNNMNCTRMLSRAQKVCAAGDCSFIQAYRKGHRPNQYSAHKRFQFGDGVYLPRSELIRFASITGFLAGLNPSDARASMLEDSAIGFVRIATWSKLKDRLKTRVIPPITAVKILLEAEDILDQLKLAKGLSFETQGPKVLLLSNKAVKYIDRLEITSIALDVTYDEVLHSVDMPEEIKRLKTSLSNMSQSLSQQESVWEIGTLITSKKFQSEVRDARTGIEKIIFQVPEKVMKDAKYMKCNQMMKDASNFEDMKLIMDSRHCTQTLSEFGEEALNSW